MVSDGFSRDCTPSGQNPIGHGQVLRPLWIQKCQDGGSYRFWYFSRLVSPIQFNVATRADFQCSCRSDMRSGQTYRRDTSHGADL
jgi:hypothetical protein